MADLLETKEDGVAILTMNRPEARNALSQPMLAALNEALPRLAADPTVGAVVITGAGGAFCAGGDVRAMNERASGSASPDLQRLRMQRQHRVVKLLMELDRPVIAAVDGPAFGAGFSLALMCDLMLATPAARFCMAFGRIGLIPDYGALYTLPRWVGLPRARELMYSAREVSAEEAQALGLVLERVPAAELMPRSLELARSLCEASPAALAMTKAALNRSLASDLPAMLDLEACGQALAGTTDYFRDAVQRFAQKQPPRLRWPGRP